MLDIEILIHPHPNPLPQAGEGIKPAKKPLLLRSRSMALIWIGQVLSQAGTRMYQIALIWWIVSRTDATAGRNVGTFMVMGALPALLLFKEIGRAVDRNAGRLVLVSCDLLSFAAVCAVGVALETSRLTLAGVYASGFLVALFQAYFEPALSKSVGELVESADIEEAVALQSSTQSLASFGGAMAGALLINRMGITGVVWLNAGSYLISAVCNYGLRLRVAPQAPTPQRENAQAGLTGWKIVSARPWLKKILLGFGCVNFFVTPILVILPLYAKTSLSAGASLLGALEASLWGGLLAGTALSKRVNFTRNTARLGSVCLALMGLCLLVPGIIVDRALFLAILFIAGTALGINNVKFLALFQETIPAESKGRFFSLMQAMLSFTFPAAFFLFGLLTDFLSPPGVCLIQGAGVLALSAYFLRLSLAAQLPETLAEEIA